MTRQRVGPASLAVTVLVGAVVSTGVAIGMAATSATSAGAAPSIAQLADGPGATTLAGDGRPGFGGDGERPTGHRSTRRAASPRTVRATSSSPTPATAGCARCRPTTASASAATCGPAPS